MVTFSSEFVSGEQSKTQDRTDSRVPDTGDGTPTENPRKTQAMPGSIDGSVVGPNVYIILTGFYSVSAVLYIIDF